ncbi:MAG: hypothetical protein ACFFDI_31195 [Promethearchaeota archaeon]
MTHVGASKGLTLPVNWVKKLTKRNRNKEIILNLFYDDDFVLIVPEGQPNEKINRLVALLEVI